MNKMKKIILQLNRDLYPFNIIQIAFLMLFAIALVLPFIWEKYGWITL